jgi:hypothetical protein
LGHTKNINSIIIPKTYTYVVSRASHVILLLETYTGHLNRQEH